MPVTYAVDDSNRIIVSRYSGVVTDAEARAHFERLDSEPGMSRGYGHLIDALLVTHSTVGAETVLAVTAPKPGRPPTRLAMVVSPANPLVYGIARQAASLRETYGDEVRFFQSIEDARAWLAPEVAPAWFETDRASAFEPPAA
jgi:hypothetical protein